MKNQPKNGMSMAPLRRAVTTVPAASAATVITVASESLACALDRDAERAVVGDDRAELLRAHWPRARYFLGRRVDTEQAAGCRHALGSATGMARLSVGDKAPAFALKDQHGKLVRLSSFKDKRVVVYFYPKADTPGCTQQSCNLRDAFPQLKKLKAVVVGISPDPPVEKQLKFDEKYELGFPLLADDGPRGRGGVGRVG